MDLMASAVVSRLTILHFWNRLAPSSMCAILAEPERNLNSKKSKYSAWLNVVQEVGADFGGCDARLRSAQLAH
eukprot:4472945-Pyramimonas_sp.AAC.1